jgi:hypothetical protein
VADKISEQIVLPQVPVVPDVPGLATFDRDQNRQLVDYLENVARKANTADLTDGGVIVGDITMTGDFGITGDFTGTGTFTWTGSGSFSGALTVADEAYDATGWNADLSVPTKNAIRDYLETLTGTTLPATYQPLDADLLVLAGLTRTRGDLIVGGATDWTDLAIGSGNQFLMSNGTDPAWTSRPTLTSLEGLTLGAGDLLYATAADTLADLAIGTAGQLLRANAGATAPEWGSALSVSSGSPVSLSGTTTDITGIPSWVNIIVMTINGLSSNGTSTPLVQLGDSGGIENTGYSANGAFLGASVGAANSTAGFIVNMATAAQNVSGVFVLVRGNASNQWMAFYVWSHNTVTFLVIGAGTKTLTAALDRVRFTFTNGTDSFDNSPTVSVYWA